MVESVTSADGRTLAWWATGDDAGAPVFALHGMASSHRQFELWADTADRVGIRLIAVDRPGYGASSFHPGRRLLDAGHEVAAIADHLGIDRFGVLGVSAGGPNALAVAHSLPGRVQAVSTLSCVGPRQRPDASSLLPAARLLFALARSRPAANRALLAPLLAVARRWPRQSVRLRGRLLPAPDRHVLERDRVQAMYEAEAAHTPATAARACAQDLALLAAGWDFDPAELQVPVRLFHGELDREAPLQQARRLAAAIPDAELRIAEGLGHLAFVDVLDDALCTAATFARP